MDRSIHKKIYRELAGQYGMPVSVIEKICDSQFLFVKETMMTGDDQQVRLQYLGLFSVGPNRREKVRKKRELMKENRRIKENKKKNGAE